MEQRLHVCRRCLPYAETREAFFQKLEQYIANLAEEDRAEQAVYEARLSACSQCSQFTDGMCRLCGCYVELRAVQKIRRCPDVVPKWPADDSTGPK